MKKKRKRRRKNKINYKLIFSTIIVFLCVLVLSYTMFFTDVLNPTIDELTSSYISFNNINNDNIKISNLKKMSDRKGNSIFNRSFARFNIYMNKDSKYMIVVKDNNKVIDSNYVYFSLNINNKNITIDKLGNMKRINNNEYIIYEGENGNKDRINIKMWISKEIKDSVLDTSYEVYIKSR